MMVVLIMNILLLILVISYVTDHVMSVDVSHDVIVQTRDNATCDTCSTHLSRLLDDVHQNLLYANRTIDILRISTRLKQRIGELDEAYEEHNISFVNSYRGLNHSIISLSTLCDSPSDGSFMDNFDKYLVHLNSSIFLQGFEKYADETEWLHLRQDNAMAAVDELLSRAQEIFQSIATTADDLNQINSNYTNDTLVTYANLIRCDRQYNDFIIEKSKSLLAEQVTLGRKAKSVLDHFTEQLSSINRMIEKSLVNNNTSCYDESMRSIHARISELESQSKEIEITLVDSRSVVQQTVELRQSLDSNAEREGDERLIISELMRDVRNLDSKLVKLSTSFNESAGQLTELQVEFANFYGVDETSTLTLPILISELQMKNQHLPTNLTSEVKSLLSHFDRQTIEVGTIYGDKFAELKIVEQFFQLPVLVQEILDCIEAINLSNHSIDLTVRGLDFNSFMGYSTFDLSMKEFSLTLLNKTRNLHFEFSAESDILISSLKHDFVTSTLDIAQNKAHLKLVERYLEHLNGSSTEKLVELELAKLNETITRNNQEASYIENLEPRVQAMSEKLLRELKSFPSPETGIQENIQELTNEALDFSKYVAHTLNDLSIQISSLVDTTKISKIVNSETNSLRHLIDSLQAKIKQARNLIGQYQGARKLEKTNFTNHSCARLRNPDEFDPNGSFLTSIEFSLALNNSSPRTKANLVFIGTPSKGKIGSDRLTMNDFISVDILDARISVTIKFGPSSRILQIVDEEMLKSNRIYRVAVALVSPLVTLTLRSELSSASVTRSSSELDTILRVNQYETEILIGCLPSPTRFLDCDGGASRHSICASPNVQIASVVLDDLSINGCRVGLWNIYISKPTPPLSLRVPADATQNQSDIRIKEADLLSQWYEASICAPLTSPNLDIYSNDGLVSFQSASRLVTFSRPKSNISSSYIQLVSQDDDLDGFMFYDAKEFAVSGGFQPEKGRIHRLNLKFRTQQANGLLLHHSKPDHSSYISIYLFGGRLMVATEPDLKSRAESTPNLSNGRWHSINALFVWRRREPLRTEHEGTLNSAHQMDFVILIVLDDEYLYRDTLKIRHPDESVIDRQRRSNNHDLRSNTKYFKYHSSSSRIDERITIKKTFDQVLKQQDESGANYSKPDNKVLYLGGVEDKYIPLLRSQHIPTNFHGCMADVVINNIRIDLTKTRKNQGVILGHCHVGD